MKTIVHLILAVLITLNSVNVDDNYKYYGLDNSHYQEYVEEYEYYIDKLNNKGLKDIEIYKSNDRSYEWFVPQLNTGRYSEDNCGPSVAVMALKWYNKDFQGTVEEARSKYRSRGGWWYTTDIEHYLDDYDVEYNIDYIEREEDLLEIINKGDIAILCIDTKYLEYCNSKLCRNYRWDNSHFIIVKGYVKTKNKIYFEVYDPWSKDFKDKYNEYEGENRFYESKYLMESIKNKWQYSITVKNI